MRSIVLAAALCGCVYSDYWTEPEPEPEPDPEPVPEPDTEPPSAAKLSFDTNVFPILDAKCSGRACHSLGSLTSLAFVESTPAAAYAHITASPVVGDFSTSAPILAFVKPGSHKGITYTPTEERHIVAWLELERAARQ